MTRTTRNQLLATISLCLLMFAVASIPAGAQALPSNPSQFDVTGYIQAATLNAGCADPSLCGGTITVNNEVIIVPANTVLQMPATALTWQQVFANSPAPYTGVATGLAMSDIPAPYANYEVHVIGNRVVNAAGDQKIAGLMFLAQHSLQSSQGFINFIHYDTGEFEVGGTIGIAGTGARVKINDPANKFGRAWSPDTRFTIDENNPTIRTGTGFPMCIPRGVAADPLCPESNRPLDAAGAHQMIFTMNAAGSATADPTLMAPMEVGDFVTYSGILVQDPAPATTTYIAAFQVIDNVGIFTIPGTEPSYVAIDAMVLGVGGTLQAGLVEATARTRFEGFTTDPSRNIFLWGIDVDSCTGKQTPRSWGSIDVDPGPAGGGAVLGRWRFRPPNKVLTMPASGAFFPATREVRAVRSNIDLSANNGDALLAAPALANGLIGGLYQAPIFEFLFPENIAVGAPIIPNNFEDMPFLAQGSGPLDGFGGKGPIVSQLDVWPLGFAAPTAKPNCSVNALAPTANAGPNQTVSSNSLVTLDGSKSTAGTTFVWSQTGGAPVLLSSTTSPNPTFTAPSVAFGSPQVVLNFTLVVTDPVSGLSSVGSSVKITVNPVATDNVTIGLVEYRTGHQRMQVDASSSALPTGSAIMTMQAYSSTCAVVAAGSGVKLGTPFNEPYIGAGIYSVVVVGASQPTSVTVTSDHGGQACSGITKLRQ